MPWTDLQDRSKELGTRDVRQSEEELKASKWVGLGGLRAPMVFWCVLKMFWVVVKRLSCLFCFFLALPSHLWWLAESWEAAQFCPLTHLRCLDIISYLIATFGHSMTCPKENGCWRVWENNFTLTFFLEYVPVLGKIQISPDASCR